MTRDQTPPGLPSRQMIDAEAFRLLVDTVQDYAIFMLDPSGRVVTWNRGAERLGQYRADEIIGRHFSELYTPEEIAAGRPARALQIAATQGRFENEGWRVRKDGSRVWMNVIITALRDEEGRLIRFAKVTRDLTDQKRSDEALRQSEDRMRLLLESVKDYAIYMLDPSGNVATWNLGAERVTGFRWNEIVGRHFSVFYPPEERQQCARDLTRASVEGRFEIEGWRMRKDGSRFWSSATLTAVRDDRGGLRGFAKITQDLTERRRAEEERLNRAKADEAVRLRDEFLSLASHELRTPLTPLSMHLQSIERQVGRGERADVAALGKARRQVRRLTGLIDDLLDFSSVQRGRLELQLMPASLNDIVRQVVDDFVNTSVGHKFVFQAAPRTPWVNVDRPRIEQVVVNLLQNAVKYSPSGGPIVVELTANDTEAWVSVTDQGIGVPLEDQARLFERFFRARNAKQRHFGGMGLGLHLSNELISRHAGQFSVESTPGKGSTFRFMLPLVGTPASGAEALSLLVVDDDDGIVGAMETFLSGEGYQVDTAFNGEQALERLRRRRYHLILVDLMMPVLDGVGFIERVRAERLAVGTPITVFSADSNVGERVAGLDVAAYLRKPLDLDDLAALVKRLARRGASGPQAAVGA